MIIVKLMGGLGNQMFQYATAKRLAFINNVELKFDISGYESMNKNDTPRQYELNLLSIKNSIATKDDLKKVKPADRVRRIDKRVVHKLGHGSAIYPYGERSSAFDPRVLKLKKNTYLVGWWQNEKYFVDIKNQLVKDFKPKIKAEGNNARWLKLARSSDSIAVHVRRGDYISNKHANVHHGLATVDYYNAAATYMKIYIKNPHFFVFSDDIAWCKKNLKFGDKVTFVEGNNGAKAYEDLRIMSTCKHNIIANSSFSWWGAWLNTNDDKIVIAPRTWFQDEKANRETDVVPDSWIRM